MQNKYTTVLRRKAFVSELMETPGFKERKLDLLIRRCHRNQVNDKNMFGPDVQKSIQAELGCINAQIQYLTSIMNQA